MEPKHYPSKAEADALLEQLRLGANVQIEYKGQKYFRFELMAVASGWTPPTTPETEE